MNRPCDAAMRPFYQITLTTCSLCLSPKYQIRPCTDCSCIPILQLDSTAGWKYHSTKMVTETVSLFLKQNCAISLRMLFHQLKPTNKACRFSSACLNWKGILALYAQVALPPLVPTQMHRLAHWRRQDLGRRGHKTTQKLS